MVRVKICGITNKKDALECCDAGADALGFIFVEKSPRKISLDKAREIIRYLPPFYGREGFLENLVNIRKIHAFRIQNEKQMIFKIMDEIARCKDGYILLNVFSRGSYGGTGKCFDWNIFNKNSSVLLIEKRKNIILSGGLTIENVERAIEIVKPWGIDVSSGVESGIGKKDRDKVREFIFRAKY